ncbi:MAG: sigma-70 family RNA polymerase sigma factor [Bacteroidia bacterium]|nr:sigma-70 family RNA polymerase sigma factor [Bacteroidia bacterium]
MQASMIMIEKGNSMTEHNSYLSQLCRRLVARALAELPGSEGQEKNQSAMDCASGALLWWYEHNSAGPNPETEGILFWKLKFLCLDHLRRASRFQPVSQDLARGLSVAGGHELWEGLEVNDCIVNQLRQALQEDSRQWEIFHGLWFDHMSSADLAEKLIHEGVFTNLNQFHYQKSLLKEKVWQAIGVCRS